MVDIDAAIGYVVAHGDQVDRARVGWLVSGRPADPEPLATVEMGQLAGGGWPALWASDVASVDATCFRLAELDDLGALGGPAARRALDWLAASQRPEGTWEEDRVLAADAPEWARPGDPEARLYLTASAGFWLAAAEVSVSGDHLAGAAPYQAARIEAANQGARYELLDQQGRHEAVDQQALSGVARQDAPYEAAAGEAAAGEAALQGARYADVVLRAAAAFRSAMSPTGVWPSFLAAGWLGSALLFHTRWYYEAAQVRAILADRVHELGSADLAAMVATLRRVGVPVDDDLIVVARGRLGRLQRGDGSWPGDDPAFDVHTTIAAIRAFG